MTEALARLGEKSKAAIWEILADKAKDCALGDSSVRTETAQELLRSILYILSLADRAGASALPAKEKYKKGEEILLQKLDAAQAEYARVRLPDIAGAAMRETVKSIGGFFKLYRWDLFAHEIPASVDYRLLQAPDGLLGAEYILTYLERLNIENAFIARFDQRLAGEILEKACPGGGDAGENRCAQLLYNASALLALKQDPQALFVPYALLPQLQKTLRESPESLSRAIWDDLSDIESGAREYLVSALDSLRARISCADSLERIFIG